MNAPDFASAYRRNMRHWALIWRATRSTNINLAGYARHNAIRNREWARGAR